MGVYGIIKNEDSTLSVRKTRGHCRGMWDLPGGSMEFGETIFETLFRDIHEETGLNIKKATPFTNVAFTVEYTENNQLIKLHHICLIYTID